MGAALPVVRNLLCQRKNQMKIKTALVILFLALPVTSHALCTLVWDPPTTNTIGESLSPGDIWAYRVYVVNKNDTFVKGAPDVEIVSIAQGTSDPPSNITCASTSVTPGKKVAVTAVGNFENESDFSNALTSVHPGKPGNARTEDR
jgi:hypothetical protein